MRSGTVVFPSRAPRDTLFTLPVTWVVLDSVRCERSGTPLTPYVDWRMVEPGNRIWLYRPLGTDDSLRVEYWYQPIPIARTHVRRVFRALARPDSARDGAETAHVVSEPAVARDEPQEWSRLSKSGSLLRSVQVGTGQDLKLESALNVQLNGRVGKDVDVVAALSDQSTPIQPEGTTETLSELEKVFVSVRGRHFSTTIGDFSLELPGGQYDNYSRKLTGVVGELTAGAAGLSASGAVSRGQFHTNSFSGQEANQGPYPLRGKRGETGIVVLAGSETVWLDGERMRRGEGNDYTIDYSAGEVRFTARRVITADSRIVVDFEYSLQDYERFYGAGRAKSEFVSGKIGGSVTLISESDDRSRPVGLALSDEDRNALANAGDLADSAVVFAADSIGDRGGDYVRMDTLLNEERHSIFVYSSRDTAGGFTGQWRVLFDDFGVGYGDYDASADSRGFTYFYWVGVGNGRYRPFRRLPLPQSHTLADLRLKTTPAAGVTLSGELAATRRDLNTTSALNDGDNEGLAYSVATSYARERAKLLLVTPYQVDIRAQIRARDRQFVELSRVTEVEFERAWDATSHRASSEVIREFDARVNPFRPVALSAGYGDLQRGASASSVRRQVGVALSPASQWSASVLHLSISSSDSLQARRGQWIRQNAQLRGRLGRFAPRAGADRERKRNDTRGEIGGFRYFSCQSGLGVALPGNISLDGDYLRRVEESLRTDDQFTRRSRSYTAGMIAEWRPQSIGQAALRFAHREKDYVSLDSADVTSDVGRLEVLLLPQNRLIEANLTYDLARTRTQSQILVAFEVPEGTGNYRREGNQYVPDDQGNYILVPRYTGFYEPASQVSLNALFAVRPDELSGSTAPSWIRALSSESELTLDEQTRLPLSLRLIGFDQSVYRGDSTLTGTLSLRQDLHINRISRRSAVRLRYRMSESSQNQFLNGGQQRSTREVGARIRASYRRNVQGESEAVLSRETSSYGLGTLPSRELDRFELVQRTSVRLSRIWEIGADIGGSEVRDERTRTQASLREVKPRLTFSRLSKGRAEAELSWVHATSNRQDIPFELSRGSNRGENFRWSLRGSWQFTTSFSSTISYEGREDAGERTYHTGRLEVRATF